MSKFNMTAVTVLMFITVLSGCYHAKITTGDTPSTTVYEDKWADSWIAGLVPPKVVKAGNECPNGVAVVETKHSFLNLLVGVLTAEIYTPISITVTCAGRSSALVNPGTPEEAIIIPGDATEEELLQFYSDAADKARETGLPVYLHH